MSAGKATKCLVSEVGKGVKATGLAEKKNSAEETPAVRMPGL